MVKWSSTRVSRPVREESILSSTNSRRKTEYPHAKEWGWNLTLHYIQKITQNGLNT